ncbi:DUF4097 family beta strand repeat protein [Fictibacillus nanhaiensis]|uniref:DUF4097 family beta strand repeat-containing protein n=1 Tax=Fictibacillus nanhaiensis TaxID=742169 RepID=UPI001C93B7A6|nr:DUF4097 domain-containing protein [Fictibacillus nanhaiensis]MBY6036875.1 DUF4097 family beta strand repeat protein [Fictibacillus nanhaiensis]
MEERKMILNMLNEGKISAEEAEKLLYALNDKKKMQIGSLSLKKKAVNGATAVKLPTSSYKVAKFFDRVVKRIKTVDFDLNFGPSEPVHYVFQDSHVMFQEMDIEVYNGSVTIVPWDRKDVQVECDAHVYKVPEGSSAKTKFRNETFYDCDATKMRFYSRNKHQKVNAVISIPKNSFEEIKVTTFNGPVKLSDCEAKTLTVKTTVGAIAVNHCSGQTIKATAANGSLTLKDCQYRDVEAETMNGPVRMTVDAVQVRSETINGSIYCRFAAPVEGYASFKTVTGKIETEFPETLELDAQLKTIVGGFVCDFEALEVREEKKEVTRKFLSFIANKDTSWPSFKLEAEAKTGSVTVLKAK